MHLAKREMHWRSNHEDYRSLYGNPVAAPAGYGKSGSNINHIEWIFAMNLQPLLEASLAVRIHVASVVPAAVLGGWLLYARKGTPTHRLLGKLWLLLMVLTSLSTFFIHEIRMIGDFSPIHLLSIFVIVSAFLAIRAARRHQIQAHRRSVISMYVGGIGVAGLFTFLPGRIMNAIVFTSNAGGLGDARGIAGFAGLMAILTLVMFGFAKSMSYRRN